VEFVAYVRELAIGLSVGFYTGLRIGLREDTA